VSKRTAWREEVGSRAKKVREVGRGIAERYCTWMCPVAEEVNISLPIAGSLGTAGPFSSDYLPFPVKYNYVCVFNRADFIGEMQL
jgi:hypothetical protein